MARSQDFRCHKSVNSHNNPFTFFKMKKKKKKSHTHTILLICCITHRKHFTWTPRLSHFISMNVKNMITFMLQYKAVCPYLNVHTFEFIIYVRKGSTICVLQYTMTDVCSHLLESLLTHTHTNTHTQASSSPGIHQN